MATYLAYRDHGEGRGRHRQEGLPVRADRVGLDGRARARHQRRPEDDGHHLAVVVSVAMVVGAFLLWRANHAKAVEPEETISEHPAFGPGAPVAAAA
jgi:hypothetical protein